MGLPNEDMRRCLIDFDVDGAVAIWGKWCRHLPLPKSREQAIPMLHAARTAARSVPMRQRAYSHRWLTERNFPSLLPDILKPRAERLYPIRVGAVGIAVSSRYPIVTLSVRGAMEAAVEDCYANGDDDPHIVHMQMMAARQREKRALGLLRRGE